MENSTGNKVFLSSGDLMSVSLYFLIRNNTKFWLICKAIPFHDFFVVVLDRVRSINHTSKMWSCNMKQVFPSPFNVIEILKTQFLGSLGKILLINVSCSLFTLVSVSSFEFIVYYQSGKKRRQHAYHTSLAQT